MKEAAARDLFVVLLREGPLDLGRVLDHVELRKHGAMLATVLDEAQQHGFVTYRNGRYAAKDRT